MPLFIRKLKADKKSERLIRFKQGLASDIQLLCHSLVKSQVYII